MIVFQWQHVFIAKKKSKPLARYINTVQMMILHPVKRVTKTSGRSQSQLFVFALYRVFPISLYLLYHGRLHYLLPPSG